MYKPKGWLDFEQQYLKVYPAPKNRNVRPPVQSKPPAKQEALKE